MNKYLPFWAYNLYINVELDLPNLMDILTQKEYMKYFNKDDDTLSCMRTQIVGEYLEMRANE